MLQNHPLPPREFQGGYHILPALWLKKYHPSCHSYKEIPLPLSKKKKKCPYCLCIKNFAHMAKTNSISCLAKSALTLKH